MSLARPVPRRKGRPAAVLALPPPIAWPPPETLLSRAALAELFGVSVPTFRGWERRGKGPPRAFAHGQEPRYHCREAREWLDREVRRQEAFERVSRYLATLMEAPEEPPAEPVEQPEVRAPKPARPAQIVWEADDDIDPFATAGRSAPRRPAGYFSGG
jgi:hypothetical protein